MLRITAMPPGAVDYLVQGSGCASDEHAGQVAENGVGRVGGAVDYLLAGAEREPAGVWFGEGLPMLGIEPGTAGTEAQVRAVFGRLEHPTRVDGAGEPLALGSRPRSFRPFEERLAEALAKEPDAAEERRREITAGVSAGKPTARAYFDFTFSPVKSVSVYWAALLVAGRDVEAAKVVAAHHEGVAAAMAYVEREAAIVRSGYHGKTASGQSVGEYQQAVGLVWTRWDHSTSRAREPHLHSHVAVLNRAETVSDGVIRALASRGFEPIKQAIDAIYTQTLEAKLTASNAVVFATRPDGRAREILGFSPELLAKASSRDVDVTARQAELVRQFEQAHGRAPSPRDRKQMHDAAWRETRQAKTHIAPGRQVFAWAEPLREALTAALTAAALWVERVARSGHPDHVGYAERSREEVLRAAVSVAQAQYATWTVGNLAMAVAAEQARTPSVTGTPAELAVEVLGELHRYGLVQVSARDVGPVPQAVQGPGGVSKYRLKNAVYYTTTNQLQVETAIVERGRRTGAPALAGPAAELARAELRATKLSDEQREKVLAVVSSGQGGDVLIGPAGAGKSRAVGALARVWQTHVGGQVFGVATSQIATDVLVDDGLTALNTTRFLNQFSPDRGGRDHLGPLDLLVVDEAGMASTTDLDELSAIAAAAGAKLVYVGDSEQLSGVGAGGMLALLQRELGAMELTEIHRFTAAWEREASQGLRRGNPGVLGVYDDQGRIRGGTEQEMTTAAVRGYLADTVAGRRSLLVVRDNHIATRLSRYVQDELACLGRIGMEPLAVLRDGNLVGVGDLIQARRNDPTIPVEGPDTVINRQVYEVLGRNPVTGSLTVRDDDGSTAHLPHDYVRQHVTLAYAVTAHGSQGLTVDTSHSLIDSTTSRAGVYVPGTRGRDANTFYVVCRQTRDHHAPQGMHSTPRAVLADILTRPDHAGLAAELARGEGLDEGRSLAWVGVPWDLLTAEHTRDRATDTLLDLLGADTVDRVTGEAGYPRLMAAVRAMELAGHDPHPVLTEAVRQASLHDATSVSDVLRYRIRRLDHSGRTPEREVRDGDWTTYTTSLAGPVGDYARQLATVATVRQTELGERAAAHPPAWALTAPTLGQPPSDPGQRAEWVRRAGIVAAYRDLHAVPDTQLSVGEAPSRERAFHHALWRHAVTALGHPADALDYATATDLELREMRDAWHRAQSWAPQFVADDLRDARLAADEYRRDAVLWRAELDQHPDCGRERDMAEADVAAAEHLAAVEDARVAALEQVHAVRTDWFDRHRETQERAGFAGDELERRGLDRDTGTPVGEQQELFTLTDEERDIGTDSQAEAGTDVDTATAQTMRGLDPAQQQLDLDDVPRAVPAVAPTGHVATSQAADIAADRTAEASAEGTQHQAATAVRGAAAAVPTGRADSAADSYTELFAEVDRAADREREQPALFDAQRTAAAVAGAQPLRADGPTGGRGDSTGADHADEESTAEDSVLTVSQAARQAEIIAELRDRLAAGAAQQVRARLAAGEGDDPDTGYQRSDDVSLSDTEQVDHDSGLST